MGMLRTFLSKRVGNVSVCEGDIQLGYWEYWSDHRLSTLGTFGVKNLYLEKKPLSLRVLEGQEAERYVEIGKDALGAGKRILGAFTGGLVGLAIGHKLAKHETDNLETKDFVCFEAVLKDNKRFVAIARPDVYQAFSNNCRNPEHQ